MQYGSHSGMQYGSHSSRQFKNISYPLNPSMRGVSGKEG
jgi:hypothetical protein